MAADLHYKSVPGLSLIISRAARYLPKPALNNIPSVCVYYDLYGEMPLTVSRLTGLDSVAVLLPLTMHVRVLLYPIHNELFHQTQEGKLPYKSVLPIGNSEGKICPLIKRHKSHINILSRLLNRSNLLNNLPRLKQAIFLMKTSINFVLCLPCPSYHLTLGQGVILGIYLVQ